MSIINIHETAIVVSVDSQVRDEGHSVWSTYQGQIACTLNDLQALWVALGHGKDLFSEATTIVADLINEDMDSISLIYVEEADRQINIEISLA